jgi:hypothetical protein
MGRDGGDGSTVSQADRAQELVECLKDAGVPAELHAFGADQADFDVAYDGAAAWSLGDGDFATSWGSAVQSDQEVAAAEHQLALLISTYDPAFLDGFDEGSAGGAQDPVGVGDTTGTAAVQPYLILGDRDFTEDFRTCLESSGFTSPRPVVDPAEELKAKHQALDATTRWVKCAREHGYPQLEDPPAPQADGYRTRPAALLPADIAEPQLRELLTACPAFDKDAHTAADAELDAMYGEMLSQAETERRWTEIVDRHPGCIDPVIGFAAPGFDFGAVGDDPEGASVIDEDAARHLERLVEVLGESSKEYQEETAGR